MLTRVLNEIRKFYLKSTRKRYFLSTRYLQKKKPEYEIRKPVPEPNLPVKKINTYFIIILETQSTIIPLRYISLFWLKIILHTYNFSLIFIHKKFLPSGKYCRFLQKIGSTREPDPQESKPNPKRFPTRLATKKISLNPTEA